ncbi:MAG: hypothetical protein HYZ81_07080 [Nitrospinae bacterium]|nr:hypothetical protein [Nitrospinota bacterium]
MTPRARRSAEPTQVPPSERSGLDPHHLLLLADGRYGVEQRIHALLVRVAMPTPDWAAVGEDLRGLIWDSDEAIAAHAGAVVPVLLNLLRTSYAHSDSPACRGRLVDTCIELAQRLARHTDDSVVSKQLVAILHILARETLPSVATSSNLRQLFTLGRLLSKQTGGQPQRAPLVCLTHLVCDALQEWGSHGLTCPCHVLAWVRATLAASILPELTAHKVRTTLLEPLETLSEARWHRRLADLLALTEGSGARGDAIARLAALEEWFLAVQGLPRVADLARALARLSSEEPLPWPPMRVGFRSLAALVPRLLSSQEQVAALLELTAVLEKCRHRYPARRLASPLRWLVHQSLRLMQGDKSSEGLGFALQAHLGELAATLGDPQVARGLARTLDVSQLSQTLHRMRHALSATPDDRFPTGLLTLPEEQLLALVPCDTSPQEAMHTLMTLLRCYRLLAEKYSVLSPGPRNPVARWAEQYLQYPELHAIAQHVAHLADTRQPAMLDAPAGSQHAVMVACAAIHDLLDRLKAVILSPQRFPADERLTYRRHVFYGIPSVSGSYREEKFDALSLAFRLEHLLQTLLEEVCEAHLHSLHSGNFDLAIQVVGLLTRALRQQGWGGRELEELGRLLQRADLSPAQRHDVCALLIDECQGIHDRLVEELREAVDIISQRHEGSKEATQRRENLLGALLGEESTLKLLGEMLQRLFPYIARQPSRPPLLHAPARAPLALIFTFREGQQACLSALGGKGSKLLELAAAGLPVPPAFCLSTPLYEQGEFYLRGPGREDLIQLLDSGIRTLETQTGRRFGDAACPLLLAIRSGSAISMPGMLESITNVGLSPAIAEGLAQLTGDRWCAYDCYRRFIQEFASTVFGMAREGFHRLIESHKARAGVAFKAELTDAQMQTVAEAYAAWVAEAGYVIPEDPFEHLWQGVAGVVRSWNGARARRYRKAVNLLGDWGTAVIVQAMVYGNLLKRSGTGVAIVDPETGQLWGDYKMRAQGSDVVAAVADSMPLNRRHGGQAGTSLETLDPEVYRQLERCLQCIGAQYGEAQEVEFTVEGGQVWILQTRKARRRRDAADPSLRPLGYHVIARGIGASGDIFRGRIVFTAAQAEILSALPDTAAAPADGVLLVKRDAVPEEALTLLKLLDRGALLTQKGGVASHAADITRRHGLPCVTGVSAIMQIDPSTAQLVIAGVTLHVGDLLIIHGGTGEVALP